MASFHFTAGKHYSRNICGTTDAIQQNSTERWPPDFFSMREHTERSSTGAQTHSDQIPSYHNQSTATAPASPSCHSLQLSHSRKNMADTFPLMLPVLAGRQDRSILLQACILFHVSPALSFAEPDVLDRH